MKINFMLLNLERALEDKTTWEGGSGDEAMG